MMSSNSIIHLFLIISAFILYAQSQVIRKTDDYSQQIHSKVERINLKDFGFDQQIDRPIGRRPGVEREDDQKVKDTDTRRRLPPRVEPSLERRPDSDSRDSSPRFSSSRDSFSSRRSETEISSDPRRIGLASDRDASRRQDFSRDTFDRRRGESIPTRTDKTDRFPSRTIRNCSDCVDSRYLQHYYARGCTPVHDYECNCVTRFDCPTTANQSTTVCHYDGRTYRIGTRIPVKNPCRICDCRDFGRRRGESVAEIDCGIGIECPESAFGVKPEPNCYFSYEQGRCCGTQVCEHTRDPKRKQKVCRYKGKDYKLGQKIYPEEDQCKTCHCTDDWDDNKPLTSPACQTFRCDFELNRDFSSGCLPIYHEGTCCPIEYKCPKRYSLSSYTSDSTQCVFDGHKYPIGSKLSIDNVCVDCVCRVPPDFTCVHKSCPSPPPNCYVGKWDNNVCCQKYICSRPDDIRDESQFRGNFFSPKNN